MKDTNKTNTLLLTVIGVATLLVAVIGATFAYFTATIGGQESSTTITVGAGTLAINYSGGAAVDLQNVIPTKAVCTGNEITRGTVTTACANMYIVAGDATSGVAPIATKDFTLVGTNSTNTNMPYTLTLVVSKNEFIDETLEGTATADYKALKYTLTGTTDNAGASTLITNTAAWVDIPNGASNITLGSGSFNGKLAAAVTHSYTLKIYFPDTYTSQDTNKTKTFEAYITTTANAVSTTGV
jgi:hypothetical protein